jgi:hypothetical protein
MGLPKLLAKRIAQVFRGKNGDAKKRHVLSNARVEAMSIEELLVAYDPSDPDNLVGSRLKKVSKEKRCIVFKDDGSVNVEASAKLVKEVKEGFPEQETVTVDGGPRKTYRVGQRPGRYADENPLYPDRVLRPDGTCDQTGRSWEGVSTEIRQIVYLAVTKTGEITISNVGNAHDILDIVMSQGAEEKIKGRFREAVIRFGELKNKGELPSLKIELNGETVGASARPDTGFVPARY